YEMTTGRTPFAGLEANSVGETKDRILHAQPDPIPDGNDPARIELNRIIRKCLEKDRETRYQSARELGVDLKSLRRDSEQMPGGGRRAGIRQKIGSTWILLFLGLVMVLLVGVGAALLMRSPIDSIAVLPFSNDSDNPEAVALSEGITDDLINRLSQVRMLRVINRITASSYHGDPLQIGREL